MLMSNDENSDISNRRMLRWKKAYLVVFIFDIVISILMTFGVIYLIVILISRISGNGIYGNEILCIICIAGVTSIPIYGVILYCAWKGYKYHDPNGIRTYVIFRIFASILCFVSLLYFLKTDPKTDHTKLVLFIISIKFIYITIKFGQEVKKQNQIPHTELLNEC